MLEARMACHGTQHHTCTRWALLDVGSTPPREDDPAATDTMAPAIDEDKGTYKALGK
jgi:hypothetical protein